MNVVLLITSYYRKHFSPLFTEKSGSKNKKITLVEGGKVLTDYVKIAETFNSFFGNIVDALNIEKDERIFCYMGKKTDPILHAIKKYSKYPSILRISQYFKNLTEFSFVPVDKDIIAKETKNLDTKKAVPQDEKVANQKNFMDKELNQAIMVRSKLRNKFLKLKTKQSRLAYAK